jgi:hypothetical protein
LDLLGDNSVAALGAQHPGSHAVSGDLGVMKNSSPTEPGSIRVVASPTSPPICGTGARAPDRDRRADPGARGQHP